MPFNMDQESDGTRAYLALLGPAVDALKKGAPLLIDELDASLHPLLAIQLIRLFNTPSSNPKGAQLIFNTHDTNLLSGGVLRRDQIWFTEKGNDATSHLYPLSDFKPRRQENLQNGYLQGRYGAIPFINPDAFLLRFEADRVEA
jgi:AAA15 family ATPase/GTPase